MFEPSLGPQPPTQPIHDITGEDTEFIPSPHHLRILPLLRLIIPTWLVIPLRVIPIWIRVLMIFPLTRLLVITLSLAILWQGCLMRPSPWTLICLLLGL